MNKEQMSMLEVAEDLMKNKKKAQEFKKLVKEVGEIKGIDLEKDNKKKAQFYTDMVRSSKFVYCGNEEFDLKNRQKYDLFDKDAAFFAEGKAEIEKLEKKLAEIEKEEEKKKTVKIVKKATKKEDKPQKERVFEPIVKEEKVYLDDMLESDEDVEDKYDDKYNEYDEEYDQK